MIDLSGRIALVTGASRGIGRAIATTLARQGAHVIAAARGDNARATVDEIVAAGGKADVLALDVTDAAAPAAAIAATAGAHGRIDILVNNAGITQGPADAAHEARGLGRRAAARTSRRRSR